MLYSPPMSAPRPPRAVLRTLGAACVSVLASPAVVHAETFSPPTAVPGSAGGATPVLASGTDTTALAFTRPAADGETAGVALSLARASGRRILCHCR